MKDGRPLVFDIKRHALEDGPGIRSTVFFKGCQLRCVWCQNPESIDFGPEIAFFPNDCIKCGDCVEACPVSACKLKNPLLIDRKKCTRCGECVKVCPGRALRMAGNYLSVGEITEIVLRDRVFYEVSGGGVTLSGGEPTLHMEFISALLTSLRTHGIHTAIQTNGCFAWAKFEKSILPNVDLIMFDVKLTNRQSHIHFTGRSNRGIMENLKKLMKLSPEKVLPRVPLIPGFTAASDNLEAIAAFLKDLGVKRCSLLPYNPTFLSKAANYGKKADVRLSGGSMTPGEIEACRKIFSRAELVS